MLKKLGIMIFSNFLVALAVTRFIAPHGIIMGGSTGIALTVTHYLEFPLSVTVLAVNIALFLLGLLFLGKAFALSTLANSLIYPMLLAVLEKMPLPASPATDTMLAAVFGGVLLGGGVGLILRSGGSTGGTDILALVADKFLHTNLSMLMYIVDGIVLAGQLLFSNTEQALLGIFSLALFTMTMNKIMVMGKSQIQLMIISDKVDLIREKLLSEDDAGVTLFKLEKGYTGLPGKGIISLIPRRKLYYTSEIISDIDPEAFWTISEVNEVRGRGFSMDKKYS